MGIESVSRWRRSVRARVALIAGLLGLAWVPSPGFAETVEAIHTFKGANHGGVVPQGALLQASDGWLWGATSVGGDDNDGIIFRISLDGTYESVTGVPLSMGRRFVGDLVQVSDGTIFAVTTYGGDYNAGSILAVSLDGSVSLVYSFNPAGWGGYPTSGLLKASDGFLYGVLPRSEASPAVVYRLQPETLVWSIVATLDGLTYAGSKLVEGGDGALYGLSSSGYGGSVFRVTPRGTVKTIHDFKLRNPLGLLAGNDGNLYGTLR